MRHVRELASAPPRAPHDAADGVGEGQGPGRATQTERGREGRVALNAPDKKEGLR